MKKLLALAGCIGSLASPLTSFAQTADAQTANAQVNTATNSATSAPANTPTSAAPTIVRDPRTGLLYQQELQTVDQPVTSWQRKIVTRNVVTPQTVYENQQVPQTVYVAKTEYVLQSKVKGLWNPFSQPTYAYEYVPVTRWVPQTQMLTRQVPTVKMIQSTEQVSIDEPVQTTQKVTQVVLRPLPVNNLASTAGTAWTAPANPRVAAVTAYQPAYRPAYQQTYQPAFQPVASNSQPLVASLPVLSQQRPLSSFQPGTLLQAPVNGLRSIVRTATAPFQTQAGYSAPVNVATLPSTSTRDFNQAGMQATVVR